MRLALNIPRRLPEFNVAAILETGDATEGCLGVGFQAGRNFQRRTAGTTSIHKNLDTGIAAHILSLICNNVIDVMVAIDG